MGRPIGKALVRQISRDMTAAKQRGRNLASMWPWPEVTTKDPMVCDQVYPFSEAEAMAGVRLSPAVWQRCLREGWRDEVEHTRRVAQRVPR